MTINAIVLNFRGYWRAPNAGGLPDQSGVYCVYACTHNAKKKTVSLKRLLYIGESVNIQDRVIHHERWDDWERQLEWDEVLCFTAAPVEEENRSRAEAAMIRVHKPICNRNRFSLFPYVTTMISTAGRNALLKSEFTVDRYMYH